MNGVWALVCAGLLTGTTMSSQAAAALDTDTTPARPLTTKAAATMTPLGFFSQLTTPQQVLPGSIFLVLPKASHKSRKSRAARSDQQYFEVSSTGGNDIPSAALRAYRHAADVMSGCGISWEFLAAIGRVESNHGRFGGAQLGSDGISRPEIRGPQLDGAGPFAAIRDTDGGRLDRDKVWDRAVGQMQFLPATWHSVARDGDGNGRADPDDIDDSALGAAVYLCGAGDLSDTAGMARAAWRYNQSEYYVSLVLSFTNGYRTGVFTIPSPPPPERERHRKPRAKSGTGGTTKASTTTSTSTVNPPTAPKPVVSPGPTSNPPPPSPPSGPTLSGVSGTWNECAAGYCVAGLDLDLGPSGRLDDHAAGDFDHDGATGTNREEFAGLVGADVTLQVDRSNGTGVVYVIRGTTYRHPDGTFA